VASCATPIGFAGHAHAGAKAKAKLTFNLDHPVGADQRSMSGVKSFPLNAWYAAAWSQEIKHELAAQS